MPSFLLNSDDDGDDGAKHGPTTQRLEQDKIAEAVQAHTAVMFSGESGAPVVSGIKADDATSAAHSLGLVRCGTPSGSRVGDSCERRLVASTVSAVLMSTDTPSGRRHASATAALHKFSCHRYETRSRRFEA